MSKELFRCLSQRLPFLHDQDNEDFGRLALAPVHRGMNAIPRCNVRSLTFAQCNWILAVWFDSERAFKDVDIFIAVMGVPWTFSAWHYVRHVNDCLLSWDIRKIGSK